MAAGRHQLHQDLQPLAVEFGRQEADAGQVSAGMGERRDQPASDHVVGRGDQRDRPGRRLCRRYRGCAAGGEQDVGSQLHQLRGCACGLLRGPEKAPIDDQVLAFDKARFAHLFEEDDPTRDLAVVRLGTRQDAETIGAAALLRPPRSVPQGRHHPCEQYGPSRRMGAHSMTSSARARIEGGIARPSALAVLRLTTSSKLVDCWTGRSAGLAPLSILPA